MQADTKNRKVEVSLELAPYAVDHIRTSAIHELGHQVDADAGLIVFGTANAGYSESQWVNEWHRHPNHPEFWMFTGDPDNETNGNFAGLSNNNLLRNSRDVTVNIAIMEA